MEVREGPWPGRQVSVLGPWPASFSLTSFLVGMFLGRG